MCAHEAHRSEKEPETLQSILTMDLSGPAAHVTLQNCFSFSRENDNK